VRTLIVVSNSYRIEKAESIISLFQLDAPLNEQLVQPIEICPLNSALNRDQCKCNDCYRPSNDLRSCGKK